MNPTIDPGLRRRTITYIIIGIIVVVVLAVYIYTAISKKQSDIKNAASAATNSSALPVSTLTPEQAAEKAAIISKITSESPTTLTPAQAAQKAAILDQLSRAH